MEVSDVQPGSRWTVCLHPECGELVEAGGCWCFEHLAVCVDHHDCAHSAHGCEAPVHYCDEHRDQAGA